MYDSVCPNEAKPLLSNPNCQTPNLRPSMRVFLAGIMQGSHVGAEMHPQDYRGRLKQLLAEHLPEAHVYDPLADHQQSLDYDEDQGRSVFLHHNQMCGEVDLLIAFVPEASMGTAIEMWEAWRNGKIVFTISPLSHNWTVRFCSHVVFSDVALFEAEVCSGALRTRLAKIRR